MPKRRRRIAGRPRPGGRLKGSDPAILPQRRGSSVRHLKLKKGWPIHARVMADKRPSRELAQCECRSEAGRGAAGVKPIAGKIERRTVAILEAEHVAVELLGLFQIGRFDRVVL